MDAGLAYNEPRDLFFPVDHLLGAELIAYGKPADAERVYREALKHFPSDGWVLFGLAKALELQGKTTEATTARRDFEQAWKRAEVGLEAVLFDIVANWHNRPSFPRSLARIAPSICQELATC